MKVNFIINISTFLLIGKTVEGLYGGKDARIEDFKYQVSLQLFNGQGGFTHFCGGSIVSTKFVLSAAHCKTRFLI